MDGGGAIGPYQIEGELGRGGMGVVYRAVDIRLRRAVAIKALRPDIAADPAARGRLRDEALNLAALNHPNIAAIHGVEEDERDFYIVMEFVEGETLTERIWGSGLDPTPLDPAEAARICAQIVQGLAAAHRAGIVHRDLKPDNVKVRPDGLVKILDFGISSARTPAAISSQDATIVQSAPPVEAVVAGTPGYMSPEQLRGGHAGIESDIWAFGCLLYELVVGAPPFRGLTTVDIAAATLMGTPELDRVPAGLRAIVDRCLQKRADDRPRSMDEIAAIFESGRGAITAGAPAWRPPRSACDAAQIVGREGPVRRIAELLEEQGRACVLGAAGSGAGCIAEAGIAAWAAAWAAAGARADSDPREVCRLIVPRLPDAESVLAWIGVRLGMPGPCDLGVLAAAATEPGLTVLIDGSDDATGVSIAAAEVIAAEGGRVVLVADAAADLAGVMAGSRVAVEPLSAPDPDDPRVAAGSVRLDALRYLLALRGGGVPDRTLLRTLSKLCHTAGGSPRALAVVAGMLRHWPVERVAEQVERRLWSARVGGLALDDAGKAAAVTQWAVGELDSDDRMALCCAAALRGVVTARAVRGILKGDEADSSAVQRSGERLARLRERNLLRDPRAGESPEGAEAGFVAPRLTREVVRETVPPPAWQAIERAHLRYCDRLAQSAGAALDDRFEGARWRRALIERHADLLAARRHAERIGDADAAGRLSAVLGRLGGAERKP